AEHAGGGSGAGGHVGGDGEAERGEARAREEADRTGDPAAVHGAGHVPRREDADGLARAVSARGAGVQGAAVVGRRSRFAVAETQVRIVSESLSFGAGSREWECRWPPLWSPTTASLSKTAGKTPCCWSSA